MPAAYALRLGELVATFALAQDNAFGQPLESQLRSCLVATWMAEEAGYDAAVKETIYWTALSRSTAAAASPSSPPSPTAWGPASPRRGSRRSTSNNGVPQPRVTAEGPGAIPRPFKPA